MNLRGLVERWKAGAATVPQEPPPAPAAPVVAAPAPAGIAVPAASPPASEKPAAPQIVLVTVLGLEGPALAEIVETVGAECRRTHTRPLFVTDSADFAPLRAQRALFEQVIDPEICRHRRPGPDWHAYALAQYRLIGRKWKPLTTIAFGRPADPEALAAVADGRREKL